MTPWQPLRDIDPTECGGFRLTPLLGEGGLGTVFLGLRPDIPGAAAVKIFKSEYGSSDVWRQRFRREIKLIEKMAGVHTADFNPQVSLDDINWCGYIISRYLRLSTR